jgi:4-alpha-glucanotransferase
MRAWTEWPAPLAARDPDALAQARNELADAIEAQKYRQWVFFAQWNDLRRYANRRGVWIIGDMPIFVALDSADVWAHPHLFHLDDDLRPTCVSGVPPDYFSETGQLWGHPLYRWDVMAADGYRWWIDRFVLHLQLLMWYVSTISAGSTTTGKSRQVRQPQLMGGGSMVRAMRCLRRLHLHWEMWQSLQKTWAISRPNHAPVSMR